MEEITVIRRSSVAGVGRWDVRIDECAHGPGGKEIFVRFERGRWWSASVNRVPSERPRENGGGHWSLLNYFLAREKKGEYGVGLEFWLYYFLARERRRKTQDNAINIEA